MIAIFCYFCQISAKKIVVFLKKQCYDEIFAKILAVIRAKNAYFFAKFVAENIFKFRTSVPGGFDLATDISNFLGGGSG
jgi:hypothetical protein